MHSVTDRQTDGQTDGQQDDANSRSYCVAVRSAKKEITILWPFSLSWKSVHAYIVHGITAGNRSGERPWRQIEVRRVQALRALRACKRGPPTDWRQRTGRPRQIWLRTVEDDLRPLNFGLATARRRAMDRLAWRLLVDAATSSWHAPERERSLVSELVTSDLQISGRSKARHQTLANSWQQLCREKRHWNHQSTYWSSNTDWTLTENHKLYNLVWNQLFDESKALLNNNKNLTRFRLHICPSLQSTIASLPVDRVRNTTAGSDAAQSRSFRCFSFSLQYRHGGRPYCPSDEVISAQVHLESPTVQ